MRNEEGKEIEMEAVESSNMSARGYDEENQHLYVEFKGGATYLVKEFSPQDWESFKAASSAGSYYANNIRNHYPISKV